MPRTFLAFSTVSLCTMLAACSSSTTYTPPTEDGSTDALADSSADSSDDTQPGDSTAPDASDDSTADSSDDATADAGDGGLEAACTASGGTVSTQLCCASAGDFPNVCGIGACSCAPTSSHDVKVCTCAVGKCWNGSTCVTGP